jgi:hypothetical protein
MYIERECVCIYTLDIYHTVFYLLYSYGEFVCTYSCSEFLLKIFSSFAECACILRTLLDDGARICRTILFYFYYKSWKLKKMLLGLRSAIFVQKSAPVFCFHLNDPFAIVLWIWGMTVVVCCMFLSRLHGSCLMLDSLVWFFVTEIAKPCASSSSMTPKRKCSNFSTLAHWAENVFVVCFWADFWWKKIQQQLVAFRLRVNGPISLVEVLISGCLNCRSGFCLFVVTTIKDWRRTDPSNSTSCTHFRVSIWCRILSTLVRRCRSRFVCCYPTWRTEETIQEIQHCVPILGFPSIVESWAHWGGSADSLDLQCTQRAGEFGSLFLGK